MKISSLINFFKKKSGVAESPFSGRQGGCLTMYVHEGDRRAVAQARSVGAEKLVYEGGEFDPPEGIECKKKTISDEPADYFRWHKKVVDLAREYVEGMFDGNRKVHQGSDLEAFKKHLIGFFQFKLNDDIRLLVLSEHEENVVLSVKYPSVMRKLFRKGRVIGSEFLPYLFMARNFLFVFLYFLRGIFNFRTQKLKARHLLIPYHQSVYSNSELFSLHNSIEDSVVIASEKGELFKYLSETGAKVLSESQLYITPPQFLSSLRLSIFLYSQVPADYRSPFLIQAISDYIKHGARVHAYYNLASVEYIGIVRGDMYPASTLLRKISASFGVKTYSCSHTVYFYREFNFCGVDYDWYGWSGENEKEVWAEQLNESTKSICVGQITSDYRNKDRAVGWEIENPRDSQIVCVFSTTPCDYTLPNTASRFNDFVEAVCASCEDENMLVFYKSKQAVKKQRGEPVSSLSEWVESSAIERMRGELGGKFQVIGENVTVYDTYDKIDIGFVFSMTTVAFELLQNKKKVLVYWPFSAVSHPFSLHTPLLVASSISDFMDKSEKLQDMPYPAYEEYILPTLQHCLISPDSSSMAKRFVDQIESN